MTLCWRSARGDSTIITRRELLAVSGAGALAAALNAVLPAAPLGAADLLTPYIKLAGSLDERLIIWWLKGQRYGTVAAQRWLSFSFVILPSTRSPKNWPKSSSVNSSSVDCAVASEMINDAVATIPATVKLFSGK